MSLAMFVGGKEFANAIGEKGKKKQNEHGRTIAGVSLVSFPII
jgi:hypothetical protein